MAGFFFAFSFLVMRALEVQPGVAGMPVMQSINVVVFNPVFGFAFSATPAFCVLAMNAALVYRREPAATYAFTGGVLYLLGTLWVTVLVQRPEKRRARGGVRGQQCRGLRVVNLPARMDRLESRAHRGGFCRVGTADRRGREESDPLACWLRSH